MPILKRNGKTFSGTPTKVDTAKSYTTFDSADDKNPTTWSDVELLTSKEEQRSLFSKISTMFKNIRYLYKMLGTTDISNIGDGTVTGGLSVLSNNAYDLKMLGWTVPKECPVQNYVDEDGVFHQIVGRVDLSKLMWEWADTLNEFRTDLYIMGMNPYSTNIYCSKYKFGSEMYLSGMGIYIKDPNYDSSTISQFKADNKGVYFYYELATEITKPVDGNEAIKLLNSKLGNTDISAIGDGTVTGGLDALNSNLKSMKTMSETELSCFEHFINNIYPNIAVDTTNIARGVFVNNQYVAYIGSKPDANFASFLFVGYGIRVMHVTNAGGNWQSSILNNL